MKYRALKPGEIIAEGDQFCSALLDESGWARWIDTKLAGLPVGKVFQYRRPLLPQDQVNQNQNSGQPQSQ